MLKSEAEIGSVTIELVCESWIFEGILLVSMVNWEEFVLFIFLKSVFNLMKEFDEFRKNLIKLNKNKANYKFNYSINKYII